MMKKCGINFQVASNVYFNSLSKLVIGDNVYIAQNNVVIAVDLYIYDNVIIGPNCVISGGNHQFDGNSFRFKKAKHLPVIIEEGSWISANCTVLAGSILPKRSILAGGAVLTKAFTQKNSIYVGVPAKYLKQHS